MKIIKRNLARCKLCGDIIESKYTHDCEECKCGEIYVDGGKDYIHTGAKNSIDNVELLTEYEEVDSYKIEIKTHYGGYREYEFKKECKDKLKDKLIEYHEDQWDYVRILDGDDVIYETEGYSDFHS